MKLSDPGLPYARRVRALAATTLALDPEDRTGHAKELRRTATALEGAVRARGWRTSDRLVHRTRIYLHAWCGGTEGASAADTEAVKADVERQLDTLAGVIRSNLPKNP